MERESSASAGIETLGRLVEGGMNVCRLNLSHCTHEFAAQVISDLRTYIEKSNSTAEVAIWVDINGPKVRYAFTRACWILGDG
jgi:pyruvate kinase